MAVSSTEEKIALLLGKPLVRDQFEITEIAVYKNSAPDGQIKFELEKLRDWDFDFQVSSQFQFDKDDDTKLIFFRSNAVFSLAYADEGSSEDIIYDNFDLSTTPITGCFDKEQKKFIVTTNKDIYFCDIEKDTQPVDIDNNEGISSIQNIIAYEGKFYILCNKKFGKLGFFLLSLDMEKPEDACEYLISWSNKLDIANCDMHIMTEGKGDDKTTNIVISYKMININTYNIFVINLSDDKLIQYWHESY